MHPSARESHPSVLVKLAPERGASFLKTIFHEKFSSESVHVQSLLSPTTAALDKKDLLELSFLVGKAQWLHLCVWWLELVA